MSNVLAAVSFYTVTAAMGENETSVTLAEPKVEVTVLESTNLEEMSPEQFALIQEHLGVALGESITLENLLDLKDSSEKLTPEQLAEMNKIISAAKDSGELNDEVITKSDITILGADKIPASELEKAQTASAEQVAKALKDAGITDEKMIESLQAAVAEAFETAAQETDGEEEAAETK